MEGALLAAAALASALALSAALVPATRLLACRYGVLDHPGGRKIHEKAMPRLGGIAVFAAFMAVVVGGYYTAPRLHQIAWLAAHTSGAVVLLR